MNLSKINHFTILVSVENLIQIIFLLQRNKFKIDVELSMYEWVEQILKKNQRKFA